MKLRDALEKGSALLNEPEAINKKNEMEILVTEYKNKFPSAIWKYLLFKNDGVWKSDLFAENSFSIKDELKKDGFKFDALARAWTKRI